MFFLRSYYDQLIAVTVPSDETFCEKTLFALFIKLFCVIIRGDKHFGIFGRGYDPQDKVGSKFLIFHNLLHFKFMTCIQKKLFLRKALNNLRKSV